MITKDNPIKIKNRGWNQTGNNYNSSQNIPVQKGCFGYMATNLGDTIVEVNNVRLFPSATPATIAGDSVSLSDPTGAELKCQQLQVKFIQPVGAAPLVEIIQLFYLENEEVYGS